MTNNNNNNSTKGFTMLRERESIKDIVINWIIMILIISPLASVSLIGLFWVSFKLLGAI